MANGTIAVTNGSDVLLGTGTTFTTDVVIGDLITFKIQEVVYTVTVVSIVSNTKITMIRNFDGPTMSGMPWRSFPAQMIMEISAQLNVDVQYLMRGFILDKQNWQQLLTVDADVTIKLPDGSSYTGLSWVKLSRIFKDLDMVTITAIADQIDKDAKQVSADKIIVGEYKDEAAASASNAETSAQTATDVVNSIGSAVSDAQAAKNAAQAAAASVNLPPLGIGLPNMTDIANFDWQNFVFTAGANYVTSYNTWVNPPPGVTYDADTRVSIRVIYISTGSSRVGLEITPDTTSSTNFKVYKLLCVGAAGSRVFTFNQGWNSANAVPITGGGTGATTLVGAQSALGIVPQLITTLYPGGSAGSPPSIGINQRIDVANPFPGRNINFRVEILSGGIWGDPGFGSNIGSGSNSFGVVARDYNGAITIVSGVTAVGIYSNMIGNGFNSSASITTAQYRVIVWTIV